MSSKYQKFNWSAEHIIFFSWNEFIIIILFTILFTFFKLNFTGCPHFWSYGSGHRTEPSLSLVWVRLKCTHAGIQLPTTLSLVSLTFRYVVYYSLVRLTCVYHYIKTLVLFRLRQTINLSVRHVNTLDWHLASCLLPIHSSIRTSIHLTVGSYSFGGGRTPPPVWRGQGNIGKGRALWVWHGPCRRHISITHKDFYHRVQCVCFGYCPCVSA